MPDAVVVLGHPGPTAPARPVDPTRNYRWFALDGTFYYIGTSFVESSTVLPAFVATLTSSPLAIGLVTSIRSTGYLLPQVFIAALAQGLARRKPILVVGGLINRSALLLLALTAAFVTPRSPRLALGLFFAAVTVLSLSDGVSGVPWTDLLARTIPVQRRGRLFGTMQFAGGLGAFAVGFLIRGLLAHPVPGYPYNYGLLFGLGLVFFALSLTATCLVHETPGTPSPVPLRPYLRSLPAAVRGHAAFRRMMASRVLLSSYLLSLPFYIVHATEVLGFDPSLVGVFVSAQMAGGVAGGLVWGQTADRHGSQRVLVLVAGALLVVPAGALAARLLVAAGLGGVALGTYALLFALLGAGMGGVWMGYNNYLLEIVDEGSRPTYIGLMNTLSAPLGALPVVGGWFLRVTSYPALFAVTALLVAAALAGVRRLPAAARSA